MLREPLEKKSSDNYLVILCLSFPVPFSLFLSRPWKVHIIMVIKWRGSPREIFEQKKALSQGSIRDRFSSSEARLRLLLQSVVFIARGLGRSCCPLERTGQVHSFLESADWWDCFAHSLFFHQRALSRAMCFSLAMRDRPLESARISSTCSGPRRASSVLFPKMYVYLIFQSGFRRRSRNSIATWNARVNFIYAVTFVCAKRCLIKCLAATTTPESKFGKSIRQRTNQRERLQIILTWQTTSENVARFCQRFLFDKISVKISISSLEW